MKPLWAVPLILVLGTATLAAQPDPGPDDLEQGRGVARVSVMNGDITMQRSDSGDWMAAVINAPLLAGDAVASGRGSRAELQFDADNVLRLGENTQVRLATLEGGRYQMQVSNGLITYRVLRSRTADVEIDTPSVAVRPLQPGTYRIEVQPSGDTEITVRSGEAEIFSNQGSERLRAGRTILARPGAAEGSVEVQELNAAGPDEWDRWNQERDSYLERSRSASYVPPGVYGAEDLDRNGDWRNVDDYGEVWFPRVAAGWEPYSYGRWVWLDWYGWSWVSYDSWGWAPFHYGRWYRHPAYGWGWCPGPARVRTYWAPALVGFFGWGSHSGVSVGFGFGYSNIGWVPLAPGERYYPWYGSRYYGARATHVNITNVYNVTNIRTVYRNANNGAVLSMAATNFGRGPARAERVNITQIGNAGQIRGQVPVVPDRESLRFNDRTVARSAMPQGNHSTRFVQRQAPAPIERVPFEQQRQQLGRSFQSGGAAGSVRSFGEPPNTSPSFSQRPAASDGFRRFGDRGAVTTPQPAPNRNVDRSTRSFGQAPPAQTYQQSPDRAGRWRRFGDSNPNSSAPALAPQAMPHSAPSSPSPAPDRSRGSRRFGESDPPRQNFAPPPAPARNPAPAPQPQQWRQPAPERNQGFGRGDNNSGGNRPLQLNRPILQERPRPSAPAPARGNSGGGRQSERGSGHGRR